MQVTALDFLQKLVVNACVHVCSLQSLKRFSSSLMFHNRFITFCWIKSLHKIIWNYPKSGTLIFNFSKCDFFLLLCPLKLRKLILKWCVCARVFVVGTWTSDCRWNWMEAALSRVYYEALTRSWISSWTKRSNGARMDSKTSSAWWLVVVSTVCTNHVMCRQHSGN